MASDLDAADRARRELVANVSHELRTPIAVLQAELENVVDGVVEPDPDTLRTVLAQTERLGRLVAELLDLSRVDAGAQALDLDDVPVRDIADEAVAEVAVGTRVSGRRIAFRVEVDPPDATARADRGQLRQVLVNLLDNAARHAPGGTEVVLHARRGQGELVIDVTDEGPGIDPADRDTVFHRFTRGERAVGGGTGLGLSIARWAVELHGGRIRVVDPSRDPGCRIRGRRRRRRRLRGLAGLQRLLVSLLVGLFLLAVFTPLMAGADPAFEAVLDGLVPRVDGSSAAWWVVRFAAGAVVVLAAAVRRAEPGTAGGRAERPAVGSDRDRRRLLPGRAVRGRRAGAGDAPGTGPLVRADRPAAGPGSRPERGAPSLHDIARTAPSFGRGGAGAGAGIRCSSVPAGCRPAAGVRALPRPGRSRTGPACRPSWTASRTCSRPPARADRRRNRPRTRVRPGTAPG